MTKKMNTSKILVFWLLIFAIFIGGSIIFQVWINMERSFIGNQIVDSNKRLFELKKINTDLHKINSLKNRFILTGFEYYLDSYHNTTTESFSRNKITFTSETQKTDLQNEDLPLLYSLIHRTIFEMDALLKKREEDGLSVLTNISFIGKTSETFKNFEAIVKKLESGEKKSLEEKKQILRTWNLVSVIGVFFLSLFCFIELMLLRKFYINQNSAS